MDLSHDLTEELFYFFDAFSVWENSIIKAGDLTVSEAHTLEVLGHFGEMNMKQLAEKLHVTTGTTTVAVDRLENKGYAVRNSTKEDRRVYHISLTEKGRQAYTEHHQAHTELSKKLIDALSYEKGTQFLDILRKINAGLINSDTRKEGE